MASTLGRPRRRCFATAAPAPAAAAAAAAALPGGGAPLADGRRVELPLGAVLGQGLAVIVVA
jgi:hypothetical protein